MKENQIKNVDFGKYAIIKRDKNGPLIVFPKVTEDNYAITDNFIKEYLTVGDVSLVSLIKAIDVIDLLSTFVPKNNEVLDRAEEVKRELIDITDTLKSHNTCPHCKGTLYYSDLPQYEYVCPNCDENFFECEI